MCFSAEASFIAGGALTVIGILSVRKVKESSQVLFASIPLLFGMQQLAEGFVWLSLTNSDYAESVPWLTRVFIFFAQVLWPFWVPLSIMFFERENGRTLILGITTGMGFLVSALMLHRMFTENITTIVQEHHITYVFGEPSSLVKSFAILYFIATICSPFFSSYKRMWVLGGSISVSFFVTKIFFEESLVSVWCFFAAVISILVYWIVSRSEKTKRV